MLNPNWPSADNKRYIGRLDRIYVSYTEYWERDYFIERYIYTRCLNNTPENHRLIYDVMERFPGNAPVQRVDLEAFLDRLWDLRKLR